MPTTKEQAQAVLQQLPDDCTFEDIQYELYGFERMRKAEEAIQQDGSVPHDEAKRRMSAWLSK